MKFFDDKGKPLRQRGKKTPANAYYYDVDGELRPVPEFDDAQKEVFPFVHACMREKIPGIDKEGVEEAWEFMENKKKLILKYLEALKDKYTAEGDDRRRYAYGRAIRVIKSYHLPIASGMQAQMLSGIGKGIGDKIEQILKTGKLDIIDVRLQEEIEKQDIIEKFMNVWGIGSSKANRLYNQGYRDLEELEEAPLTKQERIGLKYYHDFMERIPREQITSVKPMLEKTLHEIDPSAKFCICGSYRRGVKSSGDIDILISSEIFSTGTILHSYVHALESKGFLTDQLVLGEIKYMGVAQLGGKGRRVDILSLSPNSWGTGVLHCTGSGSFNEMLRTIAKDSGYTLSEHSLRIESTGEVIPVETEREVFDILGVKYVPPEKRD